MMHLHSLELSGFKSFAKRTILEFKTPITAIVGPNGSGKSNVSESIRFVLGEQSVKSMRGKRTEDLIWNGAEAAPRGNRAAVKLVFDNTPCTSAARLFNLDFDEVSVERVVYRDASSEYLLNGSTARLRDIHELLAGAHMSHGGHHIISQGEADRILNASLRERREIIEDALGLKIYEWKRAESEKKLEQTRENMKQVESLRREIAPHISFLKKQAEKIEKAKLIKEELAGLYREYFSRENAYIAAEKKELVELGSAPRAELVALDKELAMAQAVAGAPAHNARDKELSELEKRAEAAREEMARLAREVGRIEGESAAAERALRERKASQARRSVALADVETLAREVETETLLERVKALVRAFIEKHRHAPAAGEAALEKEVAELAEKRRALEEKIAAAGVAEKEAHSAAEQLRGQMRAAEDSSREAEKTVFRLLARKSEIDGILREVGARAEALAHAEADFKRELHEAAVVAGRGALEYTTLNPPETDKAQQEESRRKIERLKIRIEDSGTSGADDVMKEYKDATEREAFLAREIADMERAAESLKGLIAELGEKLDREFKDGIARINAEFQKLFSLMFGGGTAKVIVVKAPRRTRRGAEEGNKENGEDEADAFMRAQSEEAEAEEGVEVEVSIPRKKIKGLMMLSGGERALTSIALIFALSAVKPPPFIILDETDAALDEANSKKYGDMIENLSKHSQLILITHNRETMSRAGVLYGITMERGASKLLSLAFEEAAAVAK
ncbi:MAG: Chromosome partition protein smc [Parcubacteria group bacterium GW2011_GWA2_47_12]|nr:MAG: Chromosome partition protein smc [Parcubacteria group bacterium GW2011_GWA2_47_12]